MTKVIPPSKVYSKEDAKRRLKERSLIRPGEKPVKRVRKRITQVTSLSIAPELIIRVKRDLGEGNFSRGVVKAVTRALRELDEEKELAKR